MCEIVRGVCVRERRGWKESVEQWKIERGGGGVPERKDTEIRKWEGSNTTAAIYVAKPIFSVYVKDLP